MPQPPGQPAWDIEADVVVVGSGAAGACAALEAARAGARVIVLDRFGGGGATALSGGVVYAGGGTRQQREAGVSDSPAAMFDYLSGEVGDAVSAATLREFCTGSRAMLAWLEDHGVPFEGSLCPDKTSYPTNRHYLYYSGSELSDGDVAPPAPRGHRTRGPGTSGGLLFTRLAAAVAASGVQVIRQTSAQRLVTDIAGAVAGVECRTLRGAPAWARVGHRVLHRWSAKPYVYAPRIGRALHRPVAVPAGRYCYPRVEIEVAFILGADLPGAGCREADVLAATEALAPAIELIDSRILDWQIGLPDTIADNASWAGFVLGPARVHPAGIDLRGIVAALRRDSAAERAADGAADGAAGGAVVARGRSDAVLGHPATAVAWLARTVARFGVRLRAGHIILPGAVDRAVDARPGDEFRAEFAGLGTERLSFPSGTEQEPGLS